MSDRDVINSDLDPYTPPPRYKNRSGAMVRFVIIGALLAAGAWGYMQFAQQPQTASLVPAEEQTLADSSMDAGYDAGYQVEPQTQDAVPPAASPSSATPSPAPAAPVENVPAPTTTTEQPPA